jgi:hypothetical protein
MVIVLVLFWIALAAVGAAAVLHAVVDADPSDGRPPPGDLWKER